MIWRERGEVYEARDVGRGPRFGNHHSAVGMVDEDCRAVQPSEGALRDRDVVRQRDGRVLNDRDVVAVLLACTRTTFVIGGVVFARDIRASCRTPSPAQEFKRLRTAGHPNEVMSAHEGGMRESEGRAALLWAAFKRRTAWFQVGRAAGIVVCSVALAATGACGSTASNSDASALGGMGGRTTGSLGGASGGAAGAAAGGAKGEGAGGRVRDMRLPTCARP